MRANKRKLLFIFGTRPEAIKLAPLIKAFEGVSRFDVKVCATAQHREMLDQVLNFFTITPDYDLDIMQANQSLFTLTSNLITSLEGVVNDFAPDFIFVQGDTTTAFIGALAGFYKKTKVAHVEAGLRSRHKYSPFPEEINRVMVGHVADYHFAPTQQARDNLIAEGISKNVWVVGNSVIDALFLGLRIIKEQGEDQYFNYFDYLDFSKKIILVTCHRRESFGEPIRNIASALRELADSFHDVQIVYPVHLNPHVKGPVSEILDGHPRIHLVPPLGYPHLIWLMDKSHFILTDSGGIQEEAPSLGKPVLVMRDVTERIEGIEAGTARLVGTDKNKIVSEAAVLIDNSIEYEGMARAVNPYGRGDTCLNIVEILKKISRTGT